MCRNGWVCLPCTACNHRNCYMGLSTDATYPEPCRLFRQSLTSLAGLFLSVLTSVRDTSYAVCSLPQRRTNMSHATCMRFCHVRCSVTRSTSVCVHQAQAPSQSKIIQHGCPSQHGTSDCLTPAAYFSHASYCARPAAQQAPLQCSDSKLPDLFKRLVQ